MLGIVQSAMDAIITVDERQRIVVFNEAAARIFACDAREAIGTALDRFIPERFRAAHRGHIERFAATGVTMRRMGHQTVLTGLRASGEEFPIEASISQVSAGGKKLFTVILRDVGERQRVAAELEASNRRLRELHAAMHEVREAERTRIARELHDELAQWLTALKMDAAWLATRVSADQPELSARLAKMKSVVDTTVAAVRRIAADLRPVMLDDLGLVPALENLTQQFSDRMGIKVAFHAEIDEAGLHEPHATAVYRMVQEALTNVARHARAGAVEAEIALRGDDLHVLIRDDGIGIRADAMETGKSHGLLGIRERAHTLGGNARIYSPPEGGTIVEIVIPIGSKPTQEKAA